MSQETETNLNKGDDTMKAVGALESAVAALENDKSDCGVDKEEVGSWITILGRALLSIFK